MPELAEVEFERHRWSVGLGLAVSRVVLDEAAQVFRDTDPRAPRRSLRGATLTGSEARGKQICFRFGSDLWLGVHLGMTGELFLAPEGHTRRRHEHLLLQTDAGWLGFRDPRRFGRIRFARSADEPDWWRTIPPAVTSAGFTRARLAEGCARRARSPLKALLLRQDLFPGVGNWMADEVLWRAGLHPRRRAGSLDSEELGRLFRELRFVARGALRSVGASGGDPPRGWLFWVRWKDGGICPRSGVTLVRETVGGRTTCWSPGVQPEPGGRPPRTL